MDKEKSLGVLLGEHMLEHARKKGIPVLEGRKLNPEEIEADKKRTKEVSEFLANLRRFEEESKGCDKS